MTDVEALFDYYENTVQPTVAEFLRDRRDERRGRLAAIVVDHIRDYVAVIEGKKACKVYDERKAGFAALVAVKDACDASKHRILDSSKRLIKDSSQVKATPHPGFFDEPFGFFGDASHVFLITNEVQADGTSGINLGNAIMEVMAYWDKYLIDIGYVQKS